ncbi:hypothetical protein [Devosia sp. CAU 1758]
MTLSRVGSFAVHTDPLSVAAFRNALRGREQRDPALPFTYPIVWLNAPSVREAIEDHLVQEYGHSGAILMHVGQEIRYEAALKHDVGYTIAVDLAVEPEKASMTLEAQVHDTSYQRICHLKSHIALVWPEQKG